MSDIAVPAASHPASYHEVMSEESGTVAVVAIVSLVDGRRTRR